MELLGYIIFAAIMIGGFVVGLVLRGRTTAIRGGEWLARPVILLLLFVMGINIGLDERTMGNLVGVGLSSLGFAVATILGSLLLVGLVLPLAGRSFGRKTSEAEAAQLEGEAMHEGEVLAK